MDPRTMAHLYAQAGPEDNHRPREKRALPARIAAEVAQARASTDDATLARGLYMTVAGILPEPLDDETADRLVGATRGAALEPEELAAFLWENQGDAAPYPLVELRRRVGRMTRELRQKYELEVKRRAQGMSTFLARVPALFERLHRLSLPTGAGGEAPALPKKLAPEVFAEVLNVLRGASGRVMPREHGEGVRDADVDRVEHLLLELGTGLQRTAQEPVTADLAGFLKALDHYDPTTPVSDFTLLNLGARLLIELNGPKSFFGVFAQLNLFAVLDPLLPPEEFIGTMQRLADDAEVLAASREVSDLVAGLNRPLPDETDRLPTARRLASYCLGNLTLAALETALAEGVSEEHRRGLVAQARKAAEHVAQKDSAFEAVKWYRLALAAVSARLFNDLPELVATVRRLGLEEAFVCAEKVREHFKRDQVSAAIDDGFRRCALPGTSAGTTGRAD